VYSYEISPDLPLTYATLLAMMKIIGIILGFLQPTRPYCLRYNAANEFNQSGEPSLSVSLCPQPRADNLYTQVT